MSKYIDKFEDFSKNEDFGGNDIKDVIDRENIEQSNILNDLIVEIERVRDILTGTKTGPLRTKYVDKFISFYNELENDNFDYKDETKKV